MYLCFYNDRRCWLILLLFINRLDSQVFSQSRIDYLDTGTQFSPANLPAQLISILSTTSLRRCAIACHTQSLCRIFDYGVNSSTACRLFEGDVVTMGSVISSPLTNSRVGVVQFSSELFNGYDLPCPSYCQQSRYLTCNSNSTCQCQPRHYWNGFMCIPQTPVLGAPCQWYMAMCREDINYTCLRYKKCGPLSVYSGVTIANENTSIAGSPSVGLDQPADIIVDKPTPGVILASDASKGQVVRFYDRTSITNNGSVVVRTWTSGYSLNNPYSMFLDTIRGNNLYVSDSNNNRIVLFFNMQSIAPVPKIVAGVGSGGNPLNSPCGVEIDSQGNMIVIDFDNHRILKYAPNATDGIVIAGNGSSGNGSMSLNYPCDSYLDEQNSWLYVADVFNNRIQRFSLNASLPLIGTTVAGNNGYGSGSDQLKWPYGVWVSSKTGAVYIADSWNNRIQRWDVGATSGVTVAGNPNGVAGNSVTMLNNPYRITANANETFLYITDTWNKRIQRFPLI